MNETPPPPPKLIEIPEAEPPMRGVSNEAMARHIGACALLRSKWGWIVSGDVMRVVRFDVGMRVVKEAA